MKRLFYVVLIAVIAVSCSRNADLYTFVNPMIGTDAHGHTFPGATAPFGMVQLSPDTRLDSWDGCSGYHYSDKIIYGFSHTHLSGTGCSDYGDILLMPTTGKPLISNVIDNGNTANCYPSKFQHKNEKAEAGYYSVFLDDYNIKAELTATERVGFHKYTFPKGAGNIIIDLKHRDEVIASSIRIVSNTEIEGYRRSKAWAHDQYVYFVAVFSQPFDNYEIALNDVFVDGDFEEGKNIKAYVFFNEIKEPVIVTLAISAVSIENARNNMIFTGDFNAALKDTRQKWNDELSKIKVETINRNDKVVFYTALYHSMIAPNLYTDTDGKYRGRDLNVHKADDFDAYTVFSLWDTYRATHPLLSIIDQNRTRDFIRTFLKQYEQGGTLPVWELSANETGCMIGYHSIPVIYDAYMKGIRNFDTELALEAMIHSATQQRLGIPQYIRYGFIPANDEGESVSKTLEYAYDDWCIAMFAKELDKAEIYKEYIQRAQNYKNVFDAETGFHRAKINNRWFSPFDPKEVNFNYTEANAWQYNFYVPQDVNTHIQMLGGDSAYIDLLDKMFSESSETTGREQSDITGLIGQYAHGNEPSHNFAYLYNYVGEAWKAQEKVRSIMQTLYLHTPDGLCGNEDCGQMSSWYVLSALGFYPVCPGDGKLIIGSPAVKSAVINLANGKQFSIETKNQSKENIFVKKIMLNGEEYNSSYITYDDILNGGTITFYMTKVPNKDFAAAIEHRPMNIISEHIITPAPFFETSSLTFFDSLNVNINSLIKNSAIYYTIDGSEPDETSKRFTVAFDIMESTTIKARAYHKDYAPSKIIETTFSKMPKNRSIKLFSKYANQYSAGGDKALIDFVRGGDSFRTGAWQGYQGTNIEAIVDLGELEKISEVSMGFFQDSRSWIFFPSSVEYYTSVDGKNFTPYGIVHCIVPQRDEKPQYYHFVVKSDIKTRYVKVIANATLVCPEWHISAGEPSWIFSDEIVIK